MALSFKSLFVATDEQLMWRVKLEEDHRAFTDIMERWEQPLQNLCHRMTGDAHRAEDITQAVFTRIFARREDWQPTAKFSTFLWRVAINLCHDELRRTKRRAECAFENETIEALSDQSPAPDAEAAGNERAEHVREALFRLAPHYRDVVVLRHYERLKFHEIGEVLGIPEGTVKSRMSEALSQLNRFLKHLNEDTPCKPKIQTTELLAL
ncbi:MAG TPA: RNA polymerase sigma factor [Candidatus Dormibacteraeota bacterium]|nr:RNA polymerase sigma factor [Candidatus Dormibacteraeota bacterium]